LPLYSINGTGVFLNGNRSRQWFDGAEGKMVMEQDYDFKHGLQVSIRTVVQITVQNVLITQYLLFTEIYYGNLFFCQEKRKTRIMTPSTKIQL
jgi:hypothetical protein